MTCLCRVRDSCMLCRYIKCSSLSNSIHPVLLFMENVHPKEAENHLHGDQHSLDEGDLLILFLLIFLAFAHQKFAGPD